MRERKNKAKNNNYPRDNTCGRIYLSINQCIMHYFQSIKTYFYCHICFSLVGFELAIMGSAFILIFMYFVLVNRDWNWYRLFGLWVGHNWFGLDLFLGAFWKTTLSATLICWDKMMNCYMLTTSFLAREPW